jgi:uncharacterized SAM-binding protein YcdF (DUF218 family)/glycosyltransferase involved in cell wall biosynthesis
MEVFQGGYPVAFSQAHILFYEVTMLKDQDIICVSSIDWDFIWQGHQEIMSALARNGNRVIFIENTGIRSPRVRDIPRLKKRLKDYFKGITGIRKETDNLYIFSPLVLPFPYSRIARQINKRLVLFALRRWMKILDFSDPIVWTFLPTGVSLDIINNVNKKLLIYYCIDNFTSSSASASKIGKTEIQLLKMCDLVFVTSRALYDYCIRYNDKVEMFPFGVNIDNFERVRTADTEAPAELIDIKKPIVGYVGGVHKWIDQELVKSAAQKYTDYSFVFVGPPQTDISSLSNIKNIYFLGNKKHEELPNLIKSFSVAVIPYHITDYTKNVYPTKLNEYLAMGKPVVSTALPEVEIFNLKYNGIVYIGKDPMEFGAQIERALKEDAQGPRKERIEAALDNSWKRRIEQMSGLIEPAVTRKLLDRETMWKENLSAFYRNFRKRFVRAASVIGITYLLLFYTPFIWFLAEPLKINDTPRKADAIVVFAGGVGESGKSGQGYLERVEEAVRLYNEGYAKNIIFSSGYMYVFEEPMVMKALAVSLGVPREAIILEDKAGNTYENVKFSSRILLDKGWNEILLVSSPYHMRRVELVFGKIAMGMKVTYTPVSRSSFYAHRARNIYAGGFHQQVNMAQIKGIFHEYLGILYYWWKGYI